jgi:hypothetical protein
LDKRADVREKTKIEIPATRVEIRRRKKEKDVDVGQLGALLLVSPLASF